MRVRIYQPARNAMQSGTARTRGWILDFGPASASELDPLMGWTGSGDTQSQVRMHFDSREAAEAYARENRLTVSVSEGHQRKPNIRPRGYGENFATDRREVWTH